MNAPCFYISAKDNICLSLGGSYNAGSTSSSIKFPAAEVSCYTESSFNKGILFITGDLNISGKITQNSSQTITHKTNIGEQSSIGTFCESTGKIYDGYDKIASTDCICQVKKSTTLNKRIVGIICSEDKFASHGDVLVKVNSIEGLEIGDILCPDSTGSARKATESELMFMMLYSIPMPKITSLETGIENTVATSIK